MTKHQTAIFSSRSLILQLLLDGPATGHELKKKAESRTGGKIHLGNGSIYPMLEHLKAIGWIIPVEDPENDSEERSESTRVCLSDQGEQIARSERQVILSIVEETEAPKRKRRPQSHHQRRAASTSTDSAYVDAQTFWQG